MVPIPFPPSRKIFCELRKQTGNGPVAMALNRTLILTLIFATHLFAESPFDRELVQLSEQREKAVVEASQPINKRYHDALQQVLRRATQANDLDAALRIRKAIQSVATPNSAALPPITPKAPPLTPGSAPIAQTMTDGFTGIFRIVQGNGSGRLALYLNPDNTLSGFSFDDNPVSYTLISGEKKSAKRATVTYTAAYTGAPTKLDITLSKEGLEIASESKEKGEMKKRDYRCIKVRPEDYANELKIVNKGRLSDSMKAVLEHFNTAN